ncbi:MAG: nucleotidyltransferase family protein [Candidatus Riflebacteria bacterium]|nr:nucleotidyltransferase family protein [Candidatus Riflebacteria bacterium]
MNKPVENKLEAIERLRTVRSKLKELGVTDIGIFGSFVRNQQSTESDIDILVKFSPESQSFDNFRDLSFLLEDILGRRVEVVTSDALSPYIGPYIIREVENVVLST